jgi:hypothetical protein
MTLRLLQDLHTRLQPLLIFFIDAANFIDDSAGGIDQRWELYLAVESTAAGHIIVSVLLRMVQMRSHECLAHVADDEPGLLSV